MQAARARGSSSGQLRPTVWSFSLPSPRVQALPKLCAKGWRSRISHGTGASLVSDFVREGTRHRERDIARLGADDRDASFLFPRCALAPVLARHRRSTPPIANG
ncbi:uncharacterized protein B0I36DRAFT_314790 [Microdochium trichocladiopsis]|uniref:Uncharacterized protein n=1 Tax=Microdochium trichocladiopsis TaxID=1682393 RepID=A0A9P8YF03_9PEZI|nr:uncharacterized protein B0I36DRAFT_314790 [Microdochium trichocladiopsis]KAH7037776.1 hypothetical protein B0I36DRAFT_314790 [Microdochium trichocladiopsis]